MGKTCGNSFNLAEDVNIRPSETRAFGYFELTFERGAAIVAQTAIIIYVVSINNLLISILQ